MLVKFVKVALIALCAVILHSCKEGDVEYNGKVGKEPEAVNDTIKPALLKEVLKEKKVKDAVITDADMLYISVENDGTNRSGLASYFCDMASKYDIQIDAVKIVEFGTTDSPNKDNAYGILLGESRCK